MGGLVLAWLIGEGIITWRAVAQQHRPPAPGQMLAASALFALLAVLAEYEPARGPAILFAYGIDLAVLMKVLPGTAAAPVNNATTPNNRGSAPTPTGA
jgi:hypothetical protein